jgi:hypothetical protein
LIRNISYREISGKFKLSKSALDRHKSGHLSKTLKMAKEAEKIMQGDNLLEQVKDLQNKALNILGKAEGKEDLKTALLAIRESRELLALLGKLIGQLDESPRALMVQMLKGLDELSDEQVKKLAMENID